MNISSRWRLSARGFVVVTSKKDGYPFLTVTNREVGWLSEVVFAAPADGEPWFWWSFAERIAPVTDVRDAADAVARVLRSSGV
jgi:hypothetical protein